ncbi:MAG: 3'-5' exonuclease [Chthoniobacterales bacterium]
MPPATRIRDLTLAAIDFESAGVMRGHTDVPIQVGIAIMKPGGSIDPSEFYTSFLKTDRPVAWTARQVHGISDDDIRDAPTMLELWPEFRSRLRDRAVVAHGAGTERRFLRAFPFHDFAPWIDTLTLFRRTAPDLESHALGSLTAGFGVEPECFHLKPDFCYHDALSDAIATLLLLRKYISAQDLWDAPPSAVTL